MQEVRDMERAALEKVAIDHSVDNRERGLYEKYEVKRTDGKPVGECIIMEMKDPNTWPAIGAYIKTIQKSCPQLASDLSDKIARYAVNYIYSEGEFKKR